MTTSTNPPTPPPYEKQLALISSAHANYEELNKYLTDKKFDANERLKPICRELFTFLNSVHFTSISGKPTNAKNRNRISYHPESKISLVFPRKSRLLDLENMSYLRKISLFLKGKENFPYVVLEGSEHMIKLFKITDEDDETLRSTISILFAKLKHLFELAEEISSAGCPKKASLFFSQHHLPKNGLREIGYPLLNAISGWEFIGNVKNKELEFLKHMPNLRWIKLTNVANVEDVISSFSSGVFEKISILALEGTSLKKESISSLKGSFPKLKIQDVHSQLPLKTS